MLEFLQDRFSTLKVYVMAIALVTRFLHGTLRLRPASRIRVPAWDLAIVLEVLSATRFKPIETVPEKFLTLKTFLLAITYLKRPVSVP